MTLTPLQPVETKIHNKVSALKTRLSSKRIEAGVLFSHIITENTPEFRMQGPLGLIYDILKKQQKDEGSLM